MDFKQLECFVAAVDEGSFSNAADRLQLSQSMVTIHVRNLEKELGARLLNRTTRSMELTGDGRTFYAYARQMLKLNRDSILALTSARRSEHAIDIAATLYISRYYVTPCVIGFSRAHPEASFNFVNCYNSEILAKLDEEDCAFAFSNMKITHSAYAVRDCGLTDLTVIAPNAPRFRAFRGQPFPKELLGVEPMITRSSTSSLQQEFMRWIRLNAPDTKLKVVAAIDDTETIKRLVCAGVGISLISEAAVREEAADGRLLTFPLEGAIPYHLYFIYKKKYLSPVQCAFRDFVLDALSAGDGVR